MSRILVAMSGGVDSSVAAFLLVDAGHEVVGATLRTFCYSGGPAHARSCCGLEGVQDAKAVARELGIPHSVFDVEEEFTRDVVDDFVQEYGQGRTPNPCVRCNSFTKFRDLLERAEEMGADGIATGHYVRVRHEANGRALLLRGRDARKDQAYFLWGLPREALPSLHFPLGDLRKTQVRAIAAARGLVTADKPESQEICFVPTGNYRDLLEERLEPLHPALQPGEIVTSSGVRVGSHEGFAGYTVGQRKGLPGGFSEPMFVLEVRAATREVVVGTRDELTAEGVEMDQLNWLDDPPSEGSELLVQIRHRADPAPAVLASLDEDRAIFQFQVPQSAVSPGQSGVVFAGDQVLGGGRITRRLPPVFNT